MIETLRYYLSFPFVGYALVVGILVALCASLLGVTLVLKRYSFIGDGLSHVAFGAMAVATVLNIVDNMLIIIPVTVLSAVLLLRMGQNTKIKGDAAIAMFSVSALALGYLLINLFSKSANVTGDVCSSLFGSTSILTLKKEDVILCIILSILVLFIYTFFYHEIFTITFDEVFAQATGMKVGRYHFLIACITAIIIVIGMKLVGTLLISALIIFPALSAMRLFRSFRAVMISTAIIAVCCATVGIIVSILLSTPTGATMVVANLVVSLYFGHLEGYWGVNNIFYKNLTK